MQLNGSLLFEMYNTNTHSKLANDAHREWNKKRVCGETFVDQDEEAAAVVV